MKRTLAERMRALEQQRHRLAEQEMRLKQAERRERTRRLILAGTAVERAGLLHLEPEALSNLLQTLSAPPPPSEVTL
jgi:hypothetical protein